MFEEEYAAKAEPAAAEAEPAAAEARRCWFSIFTPLKAHIVFPGDDPDMLFLDPVDLPVLRAHLEAQLKRIQGQLAEVEGAEQALRERGGSDQ